MDTPAAPTPASPPAEIVNGRVHLVLDFTRVSHVVTLPEVGDAIDAALGALSSVSLPPGAEIFSQMPEGKVFMGRRAALLEWDSALVVRAIRGHLAKKNAARSAGTDADEPPAQA